MICHGVLFLCLDVVPDDVLIHLADRLGKIAIRPEAFAPQELFQLWELFANHAACAALQYLYDLSYTFAWLDLYENMHMIRLNIDFAYQPLVQPAGIIQQLLEAADYFAAKHSLPIFWDPHEMDLQTMLCVTSRPVPGHDKIMPELPPLRQIKLWLRSGLPFIPSLKRLGFSGSFDKLSDIYS